MRMWTFAKGHGTKNDFVIVADRNNLVPVSEDDVRFLCDRRGGVGGDGLLRVTLASSIPEWHGEPGLWFMDYRNADGSIAEMCGNGLRVFVRYLLEEDLAAGERIEVATRAGLRSAWPQADGSIRTSMGAVTLDDDEVTIVHAGHSWPATKVDVGNPHAVVFLDEHEDGEQPLALGALELSHAPAWSPSEVFPQGVNVEFVEVVTDDHVRMRVFERGSGETLSCGTGTVAAAAAHLARQGRSEGQVRVDVPGGTLHIEITDGDAFITGPAVVVAHGQVQLPEPDPR